MRMDMVARAREIFDADRFATEAAGIYLTEAAPGRAVCAVEIAPKHLNAHGAVMGGVLFTLADYAFAVAANLDQPPTVSLSAQIAFLAAPRGKRLTAEAQCVRQGRHAGFYAVGIVDDGGQPVARVSIQGYRG
jgi:acyl-CoA thioesterase